MLNCGMLTIGRHFVKAPSGRTLYRHGSNMGTVMVYNDAGSIKKMLVLDAKYHGSAKWQNNSDYWDCSMENLTGISTAYFKGSASTVANCASVTDAQLNAIFTVRDTWTAAKNTGVITASSPFPAGWHCRNQKVGSQTCSLPVIQQLARIYCDGQALDAMDETVAQYPNQSIVKLAASNLWSSTEYDKYNAWSIQSNGRCLSRAKHSYTYGIVPILEL